MIRASPISHGTLTLLCPERAAHGLYGPFFMDHFSRNVVLLVLSNSQDVVLLTGRKVSVKEYLNARVIPKAFVVSTYISRYITSERGGTETMRRLISLRSAS
jgi:hypothetical protein